MFAPPDLLTTVMQQRKKISAVVGLLLCLQAAPAQNFTGGFGFVLPKFDSAQSPFLPRFSTMPISNSGRVSVSGSNFVVNGQPYRFWGVNITSGACFPLQSQASAIAARAAKMGINLVRFHHVDNPWSGNDGSLFVGGQSTRTLNPLTLNRLDYLIYQLKRHGIYTNMNLNVSRTFNSLDGVANADSLLEFAKGVTVFDPQLIALQKEYAAQLLGHVNPYTGIKLAQDPALAMVEMINENSLYGMWKDDELQPQAQGGWLIARHQRLLDSLWNRFLLDRYGTQAALQTAWQTGAGTSTERIADGGFEAAALHPNWQHELHNGAVASFARVSGAAAVGNGAARIAIANATGTGWHIQFKHVGFSLQKDTAYKIRFWARASAPRPVEVSLLRNDAPYTWYGGFTANLTTAWQQFTATIAPNENITNGRLSFNLGSASDTVWIDDVSLAEPVRLAFDPGENLTAQNLQRSLYSQRNEYARQRMKDLAIFYNGLQKKFLDNMRQFLKDSVGVLAPITGNNAFTGIQEGWQNDSLDYYDDHSYWDHPSFPGMGWDPNNWLINNTPLVRQPGLDAIPSALSGIGLHNKPFTVSEYNHASPNRYRVEMVPAIAAYGAFHGMDGLMFFEYNGGGPTSWNDEATDNFFSLYRDHSVMGHFPAAAHAYRQALIAEGQPLLVNFSEDDVYNSYRYDNTGRWGKYTPYDKRLQLTHSLRAGTYRHPQDFSAQTLPAPQSGLFTTSTNETRLNTTTGLLTTATPRYASMTGFLNNTANTAAGPMTLVSANNFAAISWVSLNEKPLATGDTSFLVLSAVQQNAGMQWGPGNNTVGSNWGTAPSSQFPLAVTLRFNITGNCLLVHLLDGTGQRKATKVATAVAPNVFEVTFDQQADQTLWYALEMLKPDAVEWMGTADANWFNAANWSCGRLPGPNSKVVINSGKTYYPTVAGADVTVWSLQVNSGATVNVASGFALHTQGR
jgi:hypothetical protein